MALVNCPECGRINISDTAEQCPGCGYNVKGYFEREKRTKLLEEESQQHELKKQQAIEKLRPELDKKLKEIDNMPYPQRPSFYEMFFNDKHYARLLIAFFAVGVICFIINLTFLGILFFLVTVGLLIFVIVKFSEEKEKYEVIVSDWEGYKQKQKNSIINDYKSYANNIEVYGTRIVPFPKSQINMSQSTNKLKCPICGSSNIYRISTFNRVISVFAVGLASSKIGKQYGCENCRHKW